jgi:hypothetical protein
MAEADSARVGNDARARVERDLRLARARVAPSIETVSCTERSLAEPPSARHRGLDYTDAI